MPEKPNKLAPLKSKKSKSATLSENKIIHENDQPIPDPNSVDYKELSEDIFSPDTLPESTERDTIRDKKNSNTPLDESEKQAINSDGFSDELSFLIDKFSNLLSQKDALLSKFDGKSFLGNANEEILELKLLERELQSDLEEFFKRVDKEISPISNSFLTSPVHIPTISLEN